MGWFEDNFGAMGDLMPMNPSPRTFLSSITNEDCPVSEPGVENKNGPLFSGFAGQGRSENGNQYDHSRGSAEGDEENSSNVISETKMSSRGGGLMERIAARAGFNAPRLNTESIRPADLSKNPEIRSPYLTIPPGLSPTTLLDSPVFLTNSMVLPSPTTGKFSFAPSRNNRNSTLMREDRDICKENAFEDASTFAFKPLSESGANPSFNVPNKVNPSGSSPQPFPTFGVSNHSDTSLLQHGVEPSKFNHGVEPPKFNSHNDSSLVEQAHFSKSHAEINSGCNFSPEQTHHSVVAENSPPLDEPHDDDDGLDQRSSGDPNIGGAPAEDGYNWRKYGQKLVKGSDYPRSYYKCTHPNCPVKKKVEQSQEGQVTIVYKGTHDHPKPPPNRRLGLGPSNTPGDSEQAVTVANGDPVWLNVQKGENLETTSLTPLGQEYGNGVQSQYEARDTVNRSSTCSNEEEEDHAAHGSASLGNDGEEDESESKRRRIETYALDMGGATRAIREPRVVVQTTSEVDILDDGYRWRKYGQKVVKGNPNPRSYYKCTSPGCNVRKHVERACHDLKSVITTYEGKHNHDVPAARNSSHASSVGSNINHPPAPPPPANSAVSSYISGPEPSQISTARVERPPLGPFGLPGRPQIGPGPGFGFGMNHLGLAASLGLVGLVNNQGKLPTLPVHPYLGHHQTQPMNGMGFMLPKPEPKLEPITDSGLNTSDGSSVYQQLTNRLPLGPQM